MKPASLDSFHGVSASVIRECIQLRCMLTLLIVRPNLGNETILEDKPFRAAGSYPLSPVLWTPEHGPFDHHLSPGSNGVIHDPTSINHARRFTPLTGWVLSTKDRC